jgi:DNA primase
MQNAKGKHAVPPYVLRATPAGSVSTPLEWRELNAKLTPAKFDLTTALKRFAKQKTDPLIGLERIPRSRSVPTAAEEADAVVGADQVQRVLDRIE